MSGPLRLVLTEEGADAERVETLTGYLRGELVELDAGDVEPTPAETPAPAGSRGFDAAALGSLVVQLAGAGQLRTLISGVRLWLARGSGPPRTVRLELDGDVLELGAATAAEQDRLVALFVDRHG